MPQKWTVAENWVEDPDRIPSSSDGLCNWPQEPLPRLHQHSAATVKRWNPLAIFGSQTEMEKNELPTKLIGNKLLTGEVDSLSNFSPSLFGMARSLNSVHTPKKIQSLITVTSEQINIQTKLQASRLILYWMI